MGGRLPTCDKWVRKGGEGGGAKLPHHHLPYKGGRWVGVDAGKRPQVGENRTGLSGHQPCCLRAETIARALLRLVSDPDAGEDSLRVQT